jgi:argininosuccinate lyase
VLRFDTGALRRAASDPELMATDAAELLVRQRVPFREAHEIVGALVRETLGDGRTLADLTLEEWREASPRFTPEVLELFDIDAAVARRRTAGGPAPDLVAEQIAAALERIQRTNTELDRLR